MSANLSTDVVKVPLRRHLGLFSSELVAAQVVDAWRLANMPFAQPDPELLKFYKEQNAR